MFENNIIEAEWKDNKSENIILKSIFSNEKVIENLLDIYDFLEKKETVTIFPENNFFSNFYKKWCFIKESFIWDRQKQELLLMFFWDQSFWREELQKKLLACVEDMETFREWDIEKKGFILFFIEAIVAEKINIGDEYHALFEQAKSDTIVLIDLIYNIVIEGLNEIRAEIKVLLDSYDHFSNRFMSHNANYLSDDELSIFQERFKEVFMNLFIYITLQKEIQSQIQEINIRLENRVILD